MDCIQEEKLLESALNSHAELIEGVARRCLEISSVSESVLNKNLQLYSKEVATFNGVMDDNYKIKKVLKSLYDVLVDLDEISDKDTDVKYYKPEVNKFRIYKLQKLCWNIIRKLSQK